MHKVSIQSQSTFIPTLIWQLHQIMAQMWKSVTDLQSESYTNGWLSAEGSPLTVALSERIGASSSHWTGCWKNTGGFNNGSVPVTVTMNQPYYQWNQHAQQWNLFSVNAAIINSELLAMTRRNVCCATSPLHPQESFTVARALNYIKLIQLWPNVHCKVNKRCIFLVQRMRITEVCMDYLQACISVVAIKL